MKTGSQTLTFCVTFLQLLLSNISLFAVLFTDASIFLRAFWLRSSVEVDVDRVSPTPLPRPTPMFLPLLTILSLVQVTVI